MARKVEPDRQGISSAGRADPDPGEAGFTLLEIVCVLAILSMLAAILLPAFPRGTSRSRLESYAIETAGLLKADRNAALRRRVAVTTQNDTARRTIRSGATSRRVSVQRCCV